MIGAKPAIGDKGLDPWKIKNALESRSWGSLTKMLFALVVVAIMVIEHIGLDDEFL